MQHTELINGFNWWESRDDVGGVGKNLQIKLYYYSGLEGRRWRLEGETYSFWAPDDTISRDGLKSLIEGIKSPGSSDYGCSACRSSCAVGRYRTGSCAPTGTANYGCSACRTCPR